MKALEDALAAAGFPDPFKILEAVPPKEYPKLLEALREKREIFKKEFGATYEPGLTDSESRREEIYAKLRCLEAAAIIIHQGRKRLPAEFELSD